MSSLRRTLIIPLYLPIPTPTLMQQHHIMPVVACQEQRLPHNPFVTLCKHFYGVSIPVCEDGWEGAEDVAKVGEEFCFLTRRGGDGEVERAGGADGFLY